MKRRLGQALEWTLHAWLELERGRKIATELERRLGLGYLADRLRREDAAIEAFFARAQRASSHTISIVAPSYGVELAHVRAFVASVERQSHRDWELCLFDDGDYRASVSAYLRDLPARDQRIHLARRDDNAGISAATRGALALARGDIIAFADVDDELHPRALEAIAASFAEDPTIDLVYTNHDVMTDWGHRRDPVYKPAWSPELLQSVNYINHCVAIRRSCLDACVDLFADDESGAQDWDLLLKASRVARRVRHVPLVLYHWRARKHSVAAGAAAKPWAFRAAERVCRAHVASLDERLTLDRVGIGPRLLTPPEVAHIRCGRDWHDPGASAAAIDRAIDDQRAELALLLVDGEPELAGDVARMAAYAVQPSVGCVWPFSGGLRCAYTLGKSGAELAPIGTVRSSFSHVSGNVLTGPLHGLLIRAKAWREAGGLTACLAELPRALEADPNAHGALMGLRCLGARKRNVAVAAVSCPIRLRPLRFAAALADVDPYI